MILTYLIEFHYSICKIIQLMFKVIFTESHRWMGFVLIGSSYLDYYEYQDAPNVNTSGTI